MKNKNLIQLMKVLDPQELVQTVFPYNKDYAVVHFQFLEIGIHDWPTWLIMIDNGITDISGHMLLTVCGDSGSTGIKFIENLNLEEYHKCLHSELSKDDFFFTWWQSNLGRTGSLALNEANRLYKYLEENGIILFEPTE